MTEYLELSYICIVPTVITGFILIFKEKSLPSVLVAGSAFLWAGMNSLWLIGDSLNLSWYMPYCNIMFFAGILCMVVALIISNDITKTLSAFRRFKLRGKL